MLRRKFIFVVTSLLVLSAGLAVGRLTARMPGPFHIHESPRAWFEQLGLTADQRQQMDAIWDQTRDKMQELTDRRHDLERERDREIHDLLSPQQQLAYDIIRQEYHRDRDEIDQDRMQLMQDADQRSRALLDDSQKARWDQLTQEIHDRHGPRGPATRESTTRPDDAEDSGA
jgi:Spy/CpxP family protein refolding chaperone